MKIEEAQIIIGDYNDYKEALEDLISQGVQHLGWANAGIDIPKGTYETAYRNWSGSSTLEVDVFSKLAYSVDMGD